MSEFAFQYLVSFMKFNHILHATPYGNYGNNAQIINNVEIHDF